MRYLTAGFVLVLLFAATPAQAAWTGEVNATEVKVTGGSSLDVLQIGTSGGYLTHSYAGPGYANEFDWNSSPAVVQNVPNSAQQHVVVEGGGDDDLLRVGDGTLSAHDVPFPIVFRGGDGVDSVIYDASKDTANRRVDIGAGSRAAGVQFDSTEGWLSVESTETTAVLTGSGNDTVYVSGTNPADPVKLDAGGGNDTAHVTGLTAFRGEFAFGGNGGDDALQVTDATSTTGSVTDIDDGGLHHDTGIARLGAGVEHRSFTAGSGADSIAKASGVPWAVDGGAGDDTIATRDAAADTVACGEGADFAVSDPLDALAADCEGSDRTQPSGDGGGSGTGGASDTGSGSAGSGGGSDGGPGSDTTAPSVAVGGVRKSVRLKALLRGLKPKLSANEPAAFQVELQGSARRVSLARAYDVILARRTLPAGTGQRAVTLKPKRRLVGRARRFSVRVVVTATDAAGNRSVVTRTVKVRR